MYHTDLPAYLNRIQPMSRPLMTRPQSHNAYTVPGTGYNLGNQENIQPIAFKQPSLLEEEYIGCLWRTKKELSSSYSIIICTIL